MDIRQVTPTYAVSPQIQPGDIDALAEAGFTRVICNRPDEEVAGDESSATIREACAAAGLSFHMIPVTHAGVTQDLIDQHRTAIDTAEGPVFAYCRSGTRSCHIWALGRAGEIDVDTIVQSGADAGYDLSGLRPTLMALEQARS
ncbi:TIGR01244 family sulfur transferase [Palleronia abyssalis]|uniref:Beta-lactamase hydrolase-like protein n=1 Tax=Palleronia abyssalis TaxID=1501240 RepID=A0A2R8BUU1_9RHOB|nr:TIGR01244 family sulfur transferase [Palleronia abyssalis]SPJ23866.1 Beta-lactamase hydrolase-like protein [Palleronia abyssalis]